eukprot:TRINITY_DN6337_c0_g1_i2.p1 TRINITY_DN6337_c0_g1~~TRINITY_DN6337_c0_g1_i2.p1  ORF type:complete len:176 (+),score=29.68 TRINITY_DN6337_c0_g1_i2:241-768(+)
MITIYGSGFSEKDKKSYIPIIHRNIVACIEELAKQSVELPKKDDQFASCKVTDPTAQKALQFVMEMKYEDGTMTPEIISNIKTLWADPGIQATYGFRSKFQLNDSAQYFLDKVEEVSKVTYVPSEQDLLRVRVRTTGIVENDFTIDRNKFKMIDVEIGRAVQQECRDRSRMPSSA